MWSSVCGMPMGLRGVERSFFSPHLTAVSCSGVSAEAARLLIHERQAVGLGIDTLSPDGGDCGGGDFKARASPPPLSPPLPRKRSHAGQVHHTVLGHDRYILENLLLTSDLPARGAWALVAPLNLAGAPEAPARVWAIIPDHSE